MELPYRAEYAKSGRANCKGCKSPIGQGTLRLAVMIQSPRFDAKIPNWYHFHCFFGNHHPKSVDEIYHFESVRIEDQELIQKAVIGPRRRRKIKKRKVIAMKSEDIKKFKIEYSSTNKATCKLCKKKIVKDEIRIAKTMNARKVGPMIWHHLICFLSLRTELGYFESAVHLPGFFSLRKKDQNEIKRKLPAIKQVARDTMNSKSENTIEGFTEEESKLYTEQNKIMFQHRDQLKILTKQRLIELLEYNHQRVPPGEESILDRLADYMTFGALLRCDACKGGQFLFEKFGYKCSGNVTECQKLVKYPPRVPFRIPPYIYDEYPFLKKYKYVARTRIVKKAPNEEESDMNQKSR